MGPSYHRRDTAPASTSEVPSVTPSLVLRSSAEYAVDISIPVILRGARREVDKLSQLVSERPDKFAEEHVTAMNRLQMMIVSCNAVPILLHC